MKTYKIEPFTTQARVRIHNPQNSMDYIEKIIDIPSPNFMAKTDRDSIEWGDMIDCNFPNSNEPVHVRAYNSVRGGMVRAESQDGKVKVEIRMVWDESDN